jgi:hypothetical protein
MLKTKLAVFTVLCFLVYGCASTSITSVIDQRSFKHPYSRLLAISTFSDLSMKAQIEGIIQKDLMYNKISCWAGVQLLPPTREYTPEEINSIIRENNIDGILIIGLTDFWTSQQHIPETASTSGRVSIIGNSINYSQRTTSYGGFDISKPRLSFESRFYDATTGEVVWMSTSTTKGNAFASFSDLAASLSASVLTRLWDNKIITKTLDLANPGQNTDQKTLDTGREVKRDIDTKETKDINKAVPDLKALKARIIKGGAILRLRPDDNSEKIMGLPLGAIFELDQILDGWVKIRILKNDDGFTIVGYINSNLVEIEK